MCCNFDLLFHLVFDVVPPRSSVILNEKGEAVARTMHKDGSREISDNLIYGELKPFNEGSTLILTCDVIGGKIMFIYCFNVLNALINNKISLSLETYQFIYLFCFSISKKSSILVG